MHRNIRLLALFNFFTDFSLFSAILVIYFTQITGSYVLAMSLYSITMVSSAIFEVPTGIFSDYIGRKKTMILGALCATLSIIFYAIGTNYLTLIIGALFEGLQRAWYSGNNEAILYETLADHNRQEDYDHYLGKTSAMFQVAAGVAVIIGGIIAIWSFTTVLWVSVLAPLSCLIIACNLIEPTSRQRQSTNIYTHLGTAIKTVWSNKKLRLLTINNAVSYAISESGFQFRSAFVNTLWPIWAVGFARVLPNIGATISFWFSGKVIKKYGAIKLLFISNIYGKVVNIISLIMANIFSPILMSTSSLFYGITEVGNSVLMQNEFSDQQRATLGSLTSFVGSLTFGFFAIFLGYLADKFGPANALLISTVISLPTIWINWHLLKNEKE